MSLSRRSFVRTVGAGAAATWVASRGREGALFGVEPLSAQGLQPAPGPVPSIILSSNENPLGTHKDVLAAVRAAAFPEASRYPFATADEVTELLARKNGVKKENVLLGSGSTQILAATTEQAASANETLAAVSETVATVNEVAQTAEPKTRHGQGAPDEQHREPHADCPRSRQPGRRHDESPADDPIPLAELVTMAAQRPPPRCRPKSPVVSCSCGRVAFVAVVLASGAAPISRGPTQPIAVAHGSRLFLKSQAALPPHTPANPSGPRLVAGPLLARRNNAAGPPNKTHPPKKYDAFGGRKPEAFGAH